MLRFGLRRAATLKKEIHNRCPACIEQDALANIALGLLTTGLQDNALEVAFRESDGLCLQHLHQAFAKPLDAETTRLLITICAEKFEGVRKQLIEFIRQTEHKTPE